MKPLNPYQPFLSLPSLANAPALSFCRFIHCALTQQNVCQNLFQNKNCCFSHSYIFRLYIVLTLSPLTKLVTIKKKRGLFRDNYTQRISVVIFIKPNLGFSPLIFTILRRKTVVQNLKKKSLVNDLDKSFQFKCRIRCISK
jgi:hypothetical protein